MTPKHAAPETINSLAHSYLTIKAQIVALESQIQPLRDNLIGIALIQGSTPPRSEKTTRLETQEFEINVRQGHSASVDQKKVAVFKRWVESLKVPYTCSRIFKRIFRAEPRYSLLLTSAQVNQLKVLAPLSKKEQAKAMEYLSECVVVTPNRPALEVKTKEAQS